MKSIISIVLAFAMLFNACAPVTAKDFPLAEKLVDIKQLPKLGDYDYSKEYFKLFFATPVSGYRYAIKNKDRSVYHKHKRKNSTPYSLTEDDLSELDFWSYKKPVVSIFIVPQPQTKNTVKLARLLGYTTALAFTVITFGIGMATLALPGKIEGYKVSKDFADMRIEDSKTKEVLCSSSKQEIRLMSNIAQQYYFADDHYEHFHNKLFLGIFEFQAECFKHEQKTKLIVEDKKNKKVLKFSIPKKLKQAINKDFALTETEHKEIK